MVTPGRRVLLTLALSACAAVLSVSAERAQDGVAADAPPPSIVLQGAPQDGAVFATWSSVPGADYVIHWRRVSSANWSAAAVGAGQSWNISPLSNGVVHLLYVEARRAGLTVAVSRVIEALPRARPDCAALDYYPWLPPVSFFCTKPALDEHLRARAIDPRSLRCRQRTVSSWDAHTPNCAYTAPDGEQFLLSRHADRVFTGATHYPAPDSIRRAARDAIFDRHDPFSSGFSWTITELPQAAIGRVSRQAHAQSFLVQYPAGLPSRITWFFPRAPVHGRYSLYHEGHGGAAVDIGADTIDWLLDRGWHVVAIDMPLLGVNRVDARPGLQAHGELEALDDGVTSPLRFFVSPVLSVVEWIAQGHRGGDPDLLLIGRSGGGWTSYLYGALDPRIDVVVSIAGGRPLSERLDAPWGAAELGDYEQTLPHLYDAVGHEHLMLAAGGRGAFYVYNEWDSCCFRVSPDSPFVAYLSGAAAAVGKPISVFVDSEHPWHSLGPRGYTALDAYLSQVLTRETRIPSAPRGMRVVR